MTYYGEETAFDPNECSDCDGTGELSDGAECYYCDGSGITCAGCSNDEPNCMCEDDNA